MTWANKTTVKLCLNTFINGDIYTLTSVKDVRANFSVHPYCALKFTRHTSLRALSNIKWAMIGQMATAAALPGFNVRRPLFFIWWIIFSTDFLRLAEKLICRLKFDFFLQNVQSNSVTFSSSFICVAVSTSTKYN